MFEEAKAKFEKMFRGEMAPEEAKAYLVALYERGESAQEIAAAVDVMRSHSIKLDLDENLREKLIDVVGTGGDKSGSFNISSTVALILSSMGSVVAKHGNRAITSNSGSADMLEALGINLNLTPKQQVKMLEEVGFTFMFAINHHPAMKHIMPIRKSLSHRTIFNILGPLTNPAGSKKYLIGVFSDAFLERIVTALSLLDTKSAVAVSSRDGMDEISICDITYATKLEDGKANDFIIDPEEYGFKLAPLEAIKGGNAVENAEITLKIFEGEKGAKRDIVLLNAAMAFVVDGKARDMQEGIEMAAESIDSGLAKKHLKNIVKTSNLL
jgi:anthranilate phosphoribosyltransferase